MVREIGAVEAHRGTGLIIPQSLVLRTRVAVVAHAACREAHAHGHRIAHRRVETESGPQPQSVVRFGRVVDIDAKCLQHGDGRVGCVVGGKPVRFLAHADVTVPGEVLQPVRKCAGLAPALSLGLRENILLDLVADLVLDRLGNVGHAHFTGSRWRCGLRRRRGWPCGAARGRPRDRGCFAGLQSLRNDGIGLGARQHTLIDQGIDQRDGGITQLAQFVALVGKARGGGSRKDQAEKCKAPTCSHGERSCTQGVT